MVIYIDENIFVCWCFFSFLLIYNKMMVLNDWYFLWILNYILCLFGVNIGVSFILIKF